ncbi:MAG: hypothetical protein ACR2O8_13240 [Rhizobiaceae bacterium]
MSQSMKIQILKIASLSLIVFGVLNFLALFTPVSIVLDAFHNLAHLTPFGSDHQMNSDSARLWVGISGGLLAGWGATLHIVASEVYENNKRLGRRIFLIGVCTWFVFDSAGSIVAGAPFNTVLNCGFLIAFLVPVLWPEQQDNSAGVGRPLSN